MEILKQITYWASDAAHQCGTPLEDATTFALQLLAWRRISESESRAYDTGLYGTYRASLDASPRACFDALIEAVREMGPWDAAQLPTPSTWAHPALQQLMIKLGSIRLEDLGNAGLLASALAQMSTSRWEHNTPAEIVSLMSLLAGDLSRRTVYCPYDEALQFTTACEQRGAYVFSELRRITPLPAIFLHLCDSRFEYRYGDPVQHPNYVEAHGLRRFNAAVVHAPWGSATAQHHLSDAFRRFRGDEKTIEHQVLRHLMAQVDGTIVLIVPPNFLFGTQTGLRSIREELVSTKQLRAVIALPTGLFQNTAIASSILVIDTRGGCESTLLINADTPRYNARNGRSRSVLEKWQVLHQDYVSAIEGEPIGTGRLVAHNEIAKNEYQLQTNRYLQSGAIEQAHRFLRSANVQKLGDLVKVLRPAPLSREDGDGESAEEVNVSDYPVAGFLSKASKQVTTVSRGNQDDLILRPNDILIVTKGALGILGKVALVGRQASGQRWVANQLSLILRVDTDLVRPQFLYRYLQSDLARAQVLNLNLGSTIPNLRPADLKAILVPMPSPEEQARVTCNFEEIVSLQAQIEALSTALLGLVSDTPWPRISGDS